MVDSTFDLYKHWMQSGIMTICVTRITREAVEHVFAMLFKAIPVFPKFTSMYTTTQIQCMQSKTALFEGVIRQMLQNTSTKITKNFTEHMWDLVRVQQNDPTTFNAMLFSWNLVATCNGFMRKPPIKSAGLRSPCNTINHKSQNRS